MVTRQSARKGILAGVILLTSATAGFCAYPQALSQGATLQKMGAQVGHELATTSTGCYIGTVGTMVYGGGVNYLMSNNHVFAEENAGAIGDDIMHVASTFCDSDALHVGELAAFVPLQFGGRSVNQVDAALAAITDAVAPALSGTKVSHMGNGSYPDYFVEPGTVTAYVGLKVKKSGRTTGVQLGQVAYINSDVTVRYDGGRANFSGQVVVSPGAFSDRGDSGSLIVTEGNGNPADNQPVALLFAGSSSYTIGNPIDVVVAQLGQALGGVQLSFGYDSSFAPLSAEGTLGPGDSGSGGSGGSGGDNPNKGGKKPRGGLTMAEAATAHASAVRDRHQAEINSAPGVVGSGIGLSSDGIRPVIAVFTSGNPAAARAKLPAVLDGIELQVVETGEFVAR